jgi:hypothetical protein
VPIAGSNLAMNAANCLPRDAAGAAVRGGTETALATLIVLDSGWLSETYQKSDWVIILFGTG